MFNVFFYFSRLLLALLFGFSFALFSFSALAAQPPSTIVNPTTSYYETTGSTVRTPVNTTIKDITPTSPTVSSYSGGMQQRMKAGVTIDAVKTSAPMNIEAKSTTANLKKGLKDLLGSPRANLAFMAGAMGINALYDAVGWVMNEGSAVQWKTYDSAGFNEATAFRFKPSTTYDCPQCGYQTVPFTCPTGQVTRISDGKQFNFNCTKYPDAYKIRVHGPNIITAWWYPVYSNNPDDYKTSPVSQNDLNNYVDAYYKPHPSDWQSLTPYMTPSSFYVTPPNSVQPPPKTTTTTTPESVIVEEEQDTYNFDVTNNDSPQPSLNMTKETEKRTYVDGVLTTTTTTSQASDSTEKEPPITDCALFPTLCDWIEWTKDDELGPEPILTITDLQTPDEFEFAINASGQCPEPLEASFMGKQIFIPFTIFCDYLTLINPLIIACAYVLSALILLRVF